MTWTRWDYIALISLSIILLVGLSVSFYYFFVLTDECKGRPLQYASSKYKNLYKADAVAGSLTIVKKDTSGLVIYFDENNLTIEK